MIFSKIINLLKYKKTILSIVFILYFVFFSDISFAAEATTGGQQAGPKWAEWLEILQGIVKIMASLLGVITAFVSLFLHPAWVNGSIFGLNTHLKEIWILVSNVVYFMFALIIIWVAFMNIIGNGKGDYELKQALPKFIVGVLMVPLSWFIIQFILSISSILTVSVLTLPYDTFENNDFFKKGIGTGSICTKYDIDMGKPMSGSTNGNYDVGFMRCDKSKIIPLTTLFDGGQTNDGNFPGVKNSVFGLISIYTYGVMGIGSADEKPKTAIETLGKISDLTITVIIDTVFVLAYGLLMVALFFALFTRGVYIWVYTMVSPIFGLFYFFGKKDGGGDLGIKFSFKEFISLAMVPVLVSAALSFGLIFLFVVGGKNGVADNGGKTADTDGMLRKCGDGDKSECIEFGGFTLQINNGSSGDQTENGKNGIGLFFNQNGVGSFIGSILLRLLGIAILWIAVMAALRSSDITKSVVEPIYSLGNSVGTLVKSAPQYMPIIPAPGGGKPLSMASLQTAGSTISQNFGQASRDSGRDFAKRFIDEPDNIDYRIKKLAEDNPNISPTKSTNEELRTYFENLVSQFDESKLKRGEGIEEINSQLKRMGIEKHKITAGDFSDISKQIVEAFNAENKKFILPIGVSDSPGLKTYMETHSSNPTKKASESGESSNKTPDKVIKLEVGTQKIDVNITKLEKNDPNEIENVRKVLVGESNKEPKVNEILKGITLPEPEKNSLKAELLKSPTQPTPPAKP